MAYDEYIGQVYEVISKEADGVLASYEGLEKLVEDRYVHSFNRYSRFSRLISENRIKVLHKGMRIVALGPILPYAERVSPGYGPEYYELFMVGEKVYYDYRKFNIFDEKLFRRLT